MTPDYQHLFDTLIINPDKVKLANAIATKIKSCWALYTDASIATGVPVVFIAITHSMECSSNFNRHLHNGDPLTARTTHVPAGRPKTGNPPFTWTESAIDALKLMGYDKVKDWSVPNMLNLFEKYNGMWYAKHDMMSPYLWSWSQFYITGKFVADGKYDPKAVSQQCGAAVLLKLLT